MFKAFWPLLFYTGCGFYVDKYTNITVDENYPWIEEPANIAADFWLDHEVLYGVSLDSVDNVYLGISAEHMDGTRIGYCSGSNEISKSKIMIEKSLIDNPTIYTSCVIAHELGHYIGMDHVRQGISLMAPVQTLTKEGKCAWSEDDQEEFERAR